MTEPARTGPRPDLDNRARILEAARTAFAEKGYSGTTIRAVAAMAEVDVALVPYYFGKKEQLFTAAMNVGVNPDELVDKAFNSGPENAGMRLTRAMLELWEDPATQPGLLALLRSAASHEDSRRAMSEYVSEVILRAYAGHLTDADAKRRAALAATQLIGVVMARHVIRVEPIASWNLEDLIMDVAPNVQRYLTGPLPQRKAR